MLRKKLTKKEDVREPFNYVWRGSYILSDVSLVGTLVSIKVFEFKRILFECKLNRLMIKYSGRWHRRDDVCS